jgi:type IV pilus assembly protein PilN
MIRINLLPVRATQKREKLRSQLTIFLLCIILVCGGCAVLYFQQMTAIQNVQDEITSINRKNRELGKKIGQVKDFEKKKADLEKKLAVLKKLKTGKSGPVHLLDELSTSLPDKLWLTSFKEQGGQIKLSGVADNENTVAVFMRHLDASPYYKNVDLAVTEQTKAGDRKMQKFTLSCSVEAPSSE